MAVQGCTGRLCNTLQQLKVSGGLARPCKVAQAGRATHCFRTYFLLFFLSANQSLARPGCARLHGRARQTDHLKYEFHDILFHFLLSPLFLFFFLTETHSFSSFILEYWEPLVRFPSYFYLVIVLRVFKKWEFAGWVRNPTYSFFIFLTSKGNPKAYIFLYL